MLLIILLIIFAYRSLSLLWREICQ